MIKQDNILQYPSPVIRRRINLRMMSLSVSTLLYSQDAEMLYAELSET